MRSGKGLPNSSRRWGLAEDSMETRNLLPKLSMFQYKSASTSERTKERGCSSSFVFHSTATRALHEFLIRRV